MVSDISTKLPLTLQTKFNLINQLLPRFWEHSYHQHFTKQGMAHSKRVYQHMSHLVQELPQKQRLSNDEIYVISIAAWLYEVGFQSTNLQPVLGFSYQTGEQLSYNQLLEVRENKHLLSYHLILESISGSSDIQFGFTRPPDAYVPIIAEVVRGCSNESLESIPEIIPVNGFPIRTRLLVALLRLADQLYIDRSRVDSKVLHLFKLPIITEAKWWLYQYVQILPTTNGKMRFAYILPSSYKAFVPVIRALIESGFEYKNNPIVQFLSDKHHLHLIPSASPTVRFEKSDFGQGLPNHIRKLLETTVSSDLVQLNLKDEKKYLTNLEKNDSDNRAVDSDSSTKLQIDAVVPKQVQLKNSFVLTVAIKQRSNPLLTEESLTKAKFGNINIAFPSLKTYVPLQIQISAPECTIHGSKARSIRLYYDEESPVFYFQLTPNKLGEINIVVEIYQEDHWIGGARVQTHVQRELLETVNTTTMSRQFAKKTGREMMKYLDYELYIGPDGHAMAKSVEGERHTQITTTIPKKILSELADLKKNKVDEALIKELGKSLYSFLFPEAFDKHFNQTEAVGRFQNAKMRIRLIIDNAKISQLPWEFMYREEGGYFLSANPNTVLSRYLRVPLPSNHIGGRNRPLNMLIIIANPSDQVALDPQEWSSMITDAVSNLIKAGLLNIDVVKHATYKNVSNVLLKQSPDIIQFVGHGVYKNNKGYLALVNEETGKSWIIDDERFVNLFMGHQDNLRLLSLATCDSAKSDSPQGFLGIAPKIVQRGVPAVVAMQYPVLIKSAKIFLENFYWAIAARKPVDWSVQHGRNSVGIKLGYNNREFATPVLYMRADDGDIF